jgi:hypothetical protein
MNDEMRTRIGNVLFEVLEKQAFLFGDPGEEPDLSSVDGYLAATVSFAGAAAGRVSLAVPASMAAELASNILGCEPDDPAAAAAAEDACREILNIVCGHVLTELYGPTPVFDLGLLESGPLATDAAPDWTGAEGGMALSVEGSPVLLRVEIPGGIPPGTPT